MERQVHIARERARLFDDQAETYDRTRPRYPGAVIDAVVGPLAGGVAVLDVACGTGIAARQMAERGADVVGVELNAGMAAVAERHGIDVEVAPFEAWNAAGRTFDVVTCAQAWHWLDPEVSADKAASVLRSGGRLCVFWNVGHHPDDLGAALHEVYRRVLPPDAGRLVAGYAADRSSRDVIGDLRPVAEFLQQRGPFAEPTMEQFPWSRTYTTAEWVDELGSHSDHIALDPALRDRLFNEITATIDALGGSFEMPYVAVLISAVRA